MNKKETSSLKKMIIKNEGNTSLSKKEQQERDAVFAFAIDMIEKSCESLQAEQNQKKEKPE